MGKTADLTDVQKTVIDTQGEPQKVIAKEAGSWQIAVSEHIHRKPREECQAKSIQEFVGALTRRLESAHQEPLWTDES